MKKTKSARDFMMKIILIRVNKIIKVMFDRNASLIQTINNSNLSQSFEIKRHALSDELPRKTRLIK